MVLYTHTWKTGAIRGTTSEVTYQLRDTRRPRDRPARAQKGCRRTCSSACQHSVWLVWGETDGLPGGSLGDVDNVKEKDCRNDKIIHKLKNWPETGNIAVEDKKKLIFPSMCFLDAKCCKKYSKIFYSLPLLVDIFQYFCNILQYFCNILQYFCNILQPSFILIDLRTPSIEPQKFVLMSSNQVNIKRQCRPAKRKNSSRWTVRKMQKTNILEMEMERRGQKPSAEDEKSPKPLGDNCYRSELRPR